jgi:non-specific serine/threonine protein kinase
MGREREVDAARQQLRRPDVRLLTLTGPAGTGKTRLALQIAGEALAEFADGVCFVPLAPLGDFALVPSAIAQALAVKESAGRPLVATLQDVLREKQVLLLLDNFEHLQPAAPQAAELVAAAPGVKLLVTSRAPLRVYGEQQLPVPPLAVPDLARLPPLPALAQIPAIALFVQRAQAVRPDFALASDNAVQVAEICVRLDGLPLALELAAARIKLLSPQAILARLLGEFGLTPLQLLTGGALDRPVRQQTLRAAIGWSYALLTPEEQALYRRLSVFAGGCTLEAAEAVGGGPRAVGTDEPHEPGGAWSAGDGREPTALPAGDRTQRAPERLPPTSVLEGLAGLVDKSLLRQDDVSGEPRFWMLDTIRAYGREQLAAVGELAAAHRRHMAYVLKLAEHLVPELSGPLQVDSLNQLERENENLRAALEWAVEREPPEMGLRLGAALWPFWDLHGSYAEGRRWLHVLLARTRPPSTPVQPGPGDALRARALSGAGHLAFRQGDLTAVRALQEEALAIQRALGDRAGMAVSLHTLGDAIREAGDHDRACALYEERLAIQRELDDVPGMVDSLMHLGVSAHLRGDHAAANGQFEACLALLRAAGGRYPTPWRLYGIRGSLAVDTGDHRSAERLYREGLTSLSAQAEAFAPSYLVEGLATVAAVRGQARRALRLAGAALAHRDAMGTVDPPLMRAMAERQLAPARRKLTLQAQAAARAEGRAMPFEEALAYATADDAGESSPAASNARRSPPSRGTAAGRPETLTAREREVVALIAQGFTNRQIAERLVITRPTAERHVANVLGKLALASRAQVAVWAVEHGMASPQGRKGRLL